MEFYRKHRKTMKDKLLVSFDCVSDGNCCMIIQKDPVMMKYNNSFQKAFKCEDGITHLFYSRKGTVYPPDRTASPPVPR